MQGGDHLVGARLLTIVVARQHIDERFSRINLISHRTVAMLAFLQRMLVEPAAHGIVVEVVTRIGVDVYQVGKVRRFNDVLYTLLARRLRRVVDYVQHVVARGHREAAVKDGGHHP